MHFGLITLFPEIFKALSYGITGRAIQEGWVKLSFWDPRQFTTDRHQTVDDRPYGGGPGMVMKVAPLKAAVAAAKAELGENTPVVYLSPQGQRLDQAGVKRLSRHEGLILLAGRYEGVDERLITACVDEEWSIGDYVLSGGELAACVIMDAIIRLLPAVLGNPASAEQDSFSEGLLDYPHYTRPEEIEGMRVPPVLLSGDHQQIARWRHEQAFKRTCQRRPDLLLTRHLTAEEERWLEAQGN